MPMQPSTMMASPQIRVGQQCQQQQQKMGSDNPPQSSSQSVASFTASLSGPFGGLTVTSPFQPVSQQQQFISPTAGVNNGSGNGSASLISQSLAAAQQMMQQQQQQAMVSPRSISAPVSDGNMEPLPFATSTIVTNRSSSTRPGSASVTPPSVVVATLKGSNSPKPGPTGSASEGPMIYPNGIILPRPQHLQGSSTSRDNNNSNNPPSSSSSTSTDASKDAQLRRRMMPASIILQPAQQARLNGQLGLLGRATSAGVLGCSASLGGASLEGMSSSPSPAQGGVGSNHHSVPEFLCHLYSMLSDPTLSDMIQWKVPVADEPAHCGGGKRGIGKIVVHDPTRLQEEVLGKYYRHSKYSSFQRQLNYFGFKKRLHGSKKGKLCPCSFVHDMLGPDPQSLLNLKRRPPSSKRSEGNLVRAGGSMASLSSTNSCSVASFKGSSSTASFKLARKNSLQGGGKATGMLGGRAASTMLGMRGRGRLGSVSENGGCDGLKNASWSAQARKSNPLMALAAAPTPANNPFPFAGAASNGLGQTQQQQQQQQQPGGINSANGLLQKVATAATTASTPDLGKSYMALLQQANSNNVLEAKKSLAENFLKSQLERQQEQQQQQQQQQGQQQQQNLQSQQYQNFLQLLQQQPLSIVRENTTATQQQQAVAVPNLSMSADQGKQVLSQLLNLAAQQQQQQQQSAIKTDSKTLSQMFGLSFPQQQQQQQQAQAPISMPQQQQMQQAQAPAQICMPQQQQQMQQQAQAPAPVTFPQQQQQQAQAHQGSGVSWQDQIMKPSFSANVAVSASTDLTNSAPQASDIFSSGFPSNAAPTFNNFNANNNAPAPAQEANKGNSSLSFMNAMPPTADVGAWGGDAPAAPAVNPVTTTFEQRAFHPVGPLDESETSSSSPPNQDFSDMISNLLSTSLPPSDELFDDDMSAGDISDFGDGLDAEMPVGGPLQVADDGMFM